VALVIDASIGLKWVLQEPDSHLALALAVSDETLLAPDFWLNEACNVLWLQVRKNLFTLAEAHEGLALLPAQIGPTPTAPPALHDVDFAVAVGADRIVVADGPFVRAMQTHPDAAMTRMLLPVREWAAASGIA
jgi:hypothetical protein